MNKTERKMVDVIRRGREDYGVLSVKAEFEAEGTRTDDLLRLVEITRRADVSLTVKIGGCEAIRDLLEAKQIGVQSIVAPMVESPYALTKFIAAKNHVFSEDEQLDTNFLFNVETLQSVHCIADLVEAARGTTGVQGVVFGRVDLSGSMGLSRSDVNSRTVTDLAIKAAEEVRSGNLDFVVGGGISVEALPALREISETFLSRFETRKVIFSANSLSHVNIVEGLKNAIHFELLWLRNKRNYYSAIADEDQQRIEMLASRWEINS